MVLESEQWKGPRDLGHGPELREITTHDLKRCSRLPKRIEALIGMTPERTRVREHLHHQGGKHHRHRHRDQDLQDGESAASSHGWASTRIPFLRKEPI